jgi:hypothetical protein
VRQTTLEAFRPRPIWRRPKLLFLFFFGGLIGLIFVTMNAGRNVGWLLNFPAFVFWTIALLNLISCRARLIIWRINYAPQEHIEIQDNFCAYRGAIRRSATAYARNAGVHGSPRLKQVIFIRAKGDFSVRERRIRGVAVIPLSITDTSASTAPCLAAIFGDDEDWYLVKGMLHVPTPEQPDADWACKVTDELIRLGPQTLGPIAQLGA